MNRNQKKDPFVSMKNIFNEFLNELKSIRIIDLAFESKNIFEKLFWILIGIIGIIWVCYFIPFQFLDWDKNPSIRQIGDFHLSELEYPAMTVCTKSIRAQASSPDLVFHA